MPGHDSGPTLIHLVEFEGQSVKYCLQEEYQDASGKVVSSQPRAFSSGIPSEKRTGVIESLDEIPAGYWDRTIKYNPVVGNSQIVRLYCDQFIIDVRYKDGTVRHITTDGLDKRIANVFHEALQTIPRRYRFKLPAIDYSVTDEAAVGPFVWQLIAK